MLTKWHCNHLITHIKVNMLLSRNVVFGSVKLIQPNGNSNLRTMYRLYLTLWCGLFSSFLGNAYYSWRTMAANSFVHFIAKHSNLSPFLKCTGNLWMKYLKVQPVCILIAKVVKYSFDNCILATGCTVLLILHTFWEAYENAALCFCSEECTK